VRGHEIKKQKWVRKIWGKISKSAEKGLKGQGKGHLEEKINRGRGMIHWGGRLSKRGWYEKSSAVWGGAQKQQGGETAYKKRKGE